MKTFTDLDFSPCASRRPGTSPARAARATLNEFNACYVALLRGQGAPDSLQAAHAEEAEKVQSEGDAPGYAVFGGNSDGKWMPAVRADLTPCWYAADVFSEMFQPDGITQ